MVAVFVDVSSGLVVYNWIWFFPFLPITELFRVLTVIPFLAVLSRRLHDGGVETSYMYIVFLPIIGFLMLLPHLIADSVNERNQFGEVPVL